MDLEARTRNEAAARNRHFDIPLRPITDPEICGARAMAERRVSARGFDGSDESTPERDARVTDREDPLVQTVKASRPRPPVN